MKTKSQHPQARWRVGKASSDGGHMRKKKTKWAETTCEIHGKALAGSPWKLKQVSVAVPENKRQRMSGCPECKKSVK